VTRLSVLLVDDDPFIREVVATALSVEPEVDVAAYATPAEALEAARAQRPDILVLDYTLPGTDGLQVLRRFADVLTPLPPVVFLTGREDVDLVARLRAAGAAEVLGKPFNPTHIAGQILAAARVSALLARDTRLDAVAARFRAHLPEAIAGIDADCEALGRAWDPAIAAGLLMRVHKLAGSAGLFKLQALGDAARTAEAAVQTQLHAPDPAVPALTPALVGLRNAAFEASRQTGDAGM
jgi:CheY-like chemotaxis protein